MAWVKAAVTFIASIWGTIKAVMAVAYVIYLWTQYKKAQRSPTYGFDIQTQCSNELPIPVVYGRVKAAGNIVWQEMSEDKSTIYAFVAFSEGEIERFEDVRANDILISDLPGSSYTEYLGTPTQTLDSRCWQYWVPEVGHEYIYYTGSGTKNVEWIVDVPAHYEG
ncbi:MAG: hypothetical protein GXY86_12785, partial [Firmicutes bacterium]|nr:hypothetical protein [Bacillota bacterium]